MPTQMFLSDAEINARIVRLNTIFQQPVGIAFYASVASEVMSLVRDLQSFAGVTDARLIDIAAELQRQTTAFQERLADYPATIATEMDLLIDVSKGVSQVRVLLTGRNVINDLGKTYFRDLKKLVDQTRYDMIDQGTAEVMERHPELILGHGL